MIDYKDVIQRDGCLDPAVLNANRFMAHGILFDNVSGEACIGDARNMAYMGVYLLMTPTQFLCVVPQDHIRSADYMSNLEGPMGSPYLDIRYPEDEDEKPVVRAHEGRSRMTAILRKHGDVTVPVCLFLCMNNHGLRAKEIEPNWIDLISQGVYREREDGRPTKFIHGPIFEQAVYYGAGNKLRQFDYRPEQALALTM